MGRFDRQIPIFGTEGQRRISEAKVTVVGCGGLGCGAITQLALAGVGEMAIADGDIVSESNLNRQFVYSGREGNKTDIMEEWVRRVSPETVVRSFPKDIEEGNVDHIIKGSDVVIDCLDNNASRMILNTAILRKCIPLVHGGVESMFGQVTVVMPGETPCLGCILGEGERTVPSLGATVSAIASIQAMEALKLITGVGEPLKGKLLSVDMERNVHSVTLIEKRKGCAYCGEMVPRL